MRAQADLALARVALPPGAVLEDLCYHAQQAAEKALKAVFMRHGWTFRYVHDLAELIAGLAQHGMQVPDSVRDAIVLTEYAHQTRYPGSNDPVTQAEYYTAMELAQAVVTWAEASVDAVLR